MGGVNILLKLPVLRFVRDGVFIKDDSVRYLINYKAACRIASATVGMSIIKEIQRCLYALLGMLPIYH